jgi:asparagine synthase (glutamine-hydrolysing)
MKNKLPEAIVWRKEKTGFEPPQKNWMQHSQVQEAIHEARKKLVQEKILNPQVLRKPVRASDSYAAENYDWRYLSVAAYL